MTPLCTGVRALGRCDKQAIYMVHAADDDRAVCGIHLAQQVRNLTEHGVVDVWRLDPMSARWR